MRSDGRGADQIRPLRFERGFTEHPGGSVLVHWGRTRVLCTAMLEEGVPAFLTNSGKGWLTAEYSMLPGATPNRRPRDAARGKVDGRSTEIQRLIGRALRACVDLNRLPGQTLWVDCDVVQADGGTRTAAINGAYVAACDAVRRARAEGRLRQDPLRTGLAAISVGVVAGEAHADLDASEDQRADVDMNVVMTRPDTFVEIQGTGEKTTFDGVMLSRLLDLARAGIEEIRAAQDAALRCEA